ncbi:hypothetical protein BG910_05490 [Neisseria chenwenguii]|uniref:Uncharacterized protein n=1 Tax=Neisseria chenwenguii TaxID=1853278 RepID=A0A220S1C3_9NEIS|nr:hypothetical protein BG910_05490 [Neisseria chenwenguii]ROV57060.1 hypothetical protein EGS38_02670 [Neisseria chenwenguii]
MVAVFSAVVLSDFYLFSGRFKTALFYSALFCFFVCFIWRRIVPPFLFQNAGSDFSDGMVMKKSF